MKSRKKNFKAYNMSGLQRVLKMYGKMVCKDETGKSVTWVWDYAKDKPMLQSEMTKEMTAASEKAKYEMIKSASDRAFGDKEMKKSLNDPPF